MGGLMDPQAQRVTDPESVLDRGLPGRARPTLEIAIAANAPPWHRTFQFLDDVYAVMRQTWIEHVADIDDYVFVLSGLEEGSKKFKSTLRRRQQTRQVNAEIYIERAEFPKPKGAGRRPRLTIGEGLQASVVLAAGILASPLLEVAFDPDSARLATAVPPPVVDQVVIDRITEYITEFGGPVRMTVTNPDGSTLVIDFNAVAQ